MNYKMNRLLKVMLIICITILLSVHNLCAQEVWEELVEQLMDEEINLFTGQTVDKVSKPSDGFFLL